MAGPGLIQTLHDLDLVDEWRLLLVPVTVGPGKRLFGEGTLPRAFELAGSRQTGTGAVFLTYRRGGPFRTGSFA
jgi:dihydrofolate reductase